MTAFILILFFKLGYAGGSSSAQFTDLAACQSAADQIKRDFDGVFGSVSAWCLPSSSGITQ